MTERRLDQPRDDVRRLRGGRAQVEHAEHDRLAGQRGERGNVEPGLRRLDRDLLRRAALEVGSIRLAAHLAVIDQLERHSDWIDQLSRQVGGPVALRADPRLAMSAGYAEPA